MEFLIWFCESDKRWHVDYTQCDDELNVADQSDIASGETLTSAAINAEIWLSRRHR